MKTFLRALLVCTKRPVCQHLLMITALMFFAGAAMGQNSTTLPNKKVEARPIRVHLGEGVQDLDPHLQVSRVGNFLVQNIFERLVTLDAERKPIPLLVDRWELGTGNLLRLHLRPGVLFHDQTPLKAADVVASIERARNHPQSVVATHLSGIREVRSAGEEWVEVVGDREVDGLLAELADVLITKADSCKADSWGTAGDAIGTGSFRVTRFQPGELLEISTFAAHWQGPPAPKTVIYRVVPQEKDRVQQLLAGEADLVFPLQPTSVEQIEEREDLWVEAQLSSGVSMLALRGGGEKGTEGPLGDPRFRQAIDLAIDRDALVGQLLNHARPAGQVVGPHTVGYVPDLEPPKRNLAAAQKLVQQVGLPADFELVIEQAPAAVGLGFLIQQQLEEAGIHTALVSRPWPRLLERMKAGKVMAFLGGYWHGGGDVGHMLGAVVHSPQEGWGVSNYFGHPSPEADALIEEAVATPFGPLREQRLQDRVRAITQDRWFLALVWPLDLYGLRRDLEWEATQDGQVLAARINWKTQPANQQ